MDSKETKVLLIEDNAADSEWVKRALRASGSDRFNLEWADTLSKGLELFERASFDVILLDMKLPDGNGLEIFDKVHSRAAHLPVVILTGDLTEEKVALQAIERGAQDYLLKGKIDSGTLTRSLRYSIERYRLLAELKKLTQVKSEFVSTVSHELRTPLAILQGTISLLSDGLVGPVGEKQKEYLEIAQRNIERLSRLINDILDYQKLEGGFEEFHKTSEDLNPIIREVSKGFAVVAAKKGLRLKTLLAEKLPSIHCDRDKITQVLTNCLNNAIKFTEKGEITVASERGENWVKVSVRDEGPGIGKVDQAKLFQSFSQLKMGGARKPGGTGLGLAISRKIIESHGGRIGVESTPGKGATFYFILPIQDRRAG